MTTRIITFLVGDPFKPSFTTVTVRGPYPIYIYIYVFIFTQFVNGHTGVLREKNTQSSREKTKKQIETDT